MHASDMVVVGCECYQKTLFSFIVSQWLRNTSIWSPHTEKNWIIDVLKHQFQWRKVHFCVKSFIKWVHQKHEKYLHNIHNEQAHSRIFSLKRIYCVYIDFDSMPHLTKFNEVVEPNRIDLWIQSVLNTRSDIKLMDFIRINRIYRPGSIQLIACFQWKCVAGVNFN